MPTLSASNAAPKGSGVSTPSRETRQGILLVITGNGKGKTTSGFGHAVRALGHGFRVAIIELMKGRIYEELEVLRDRLHVGVYQFGGHAFVDPKKPDSRD